MKKYATILLILIMSLSAQAALYSRGFTENVNPADYSKVMCEREKQLGAVSTFDKRVCCVNEDNNGFCANNEPVLGKCDSNLCIFPTKTFRESWAYWQRIPPCPGLAIQTGPEYTEMLANEGCEKDGDYWCCSPYAFPPPTQTLKPRPGLQPPPAESPTGALLVVNKQKWRAMELGYKLRDTYSMRAFEHEKNRCKNGGGSIEIIDPEYGSYFLDSRNRHPGERAFYMKPGEVTPLVTWC